MTNVQELAGRVALVTGGARGIGKAISECLVGHGANVVIADNGSSIDGQTHDQSVASDVAKTLGSSAVAFNDDIASPKAAEDAVSLAVESFGGLDIVVNNAAILRDAFIFKGDPADWDAVIRNNLSAAYYVLNAATPILRGQVKAGRGGSAYKWGRLINMVSSAGFYGNYGQAAYASAKAGLFGLTRVVALDMGRAGVTCNAVAPFAATRVTDTIKPANEEQAQYKDRALRCDSEHVARFVAGLCGLEAQEVTGQLFAVRGRELFLMSQPRPASQLITEPDWDLGALSAAVSKTFESQFAESKTDLEAFNTDPIT